MTAPEHLPPAEPAFVKKLAAEFIGTFWLVLGGCGSAVLAAAFPETGIGFLGVALAFGLSVLTMTYAVGGISGGHFNPAVTLGIAVGRRLELVPLLSYWAVQVAGAIGAAAIIYAIATGKPGFEAGRFAANGWGEASPGGYGLSAAFITEATLTAVFIFIILAVTARNAPVNFAPISIGLTLTLIHLISIPVTNTSVNPARSTGVAFFADAPALAQLWLFWVAPLIGAALGGLGWRWLRSPPD